MPASPKNDTATAEYSTDKSNQLIDYVESLVDSNEQDSSNGSFLVELIDEKFDLLSARLQEQIGDLFESLASQLNIENLDKKASTSSKAAQTDSTADEQQAELDETDDEDALNQLSAWDRQKRELLAEHGHPLEPLKKPKSAEPTPQIPRAGAVSQDKEMDALHESIESISKIDAEEIEVLKEQLTSKLRDAEVELSINRAKLSQQWATLEQRQYEIAQRESMFANKYGSLDEPAKKQGLLDRLSRHLSRNSEDDYIE